jgi:energy-coupling factor transporter ATP-binding protein EcfA2
MIIWITGQPGSGKSTLAEALAEALRGQGLQVSRLDGDGLRKRTGNRDYTADGRISNVQAGQRLAVELAALDYVVVASFVSPHRWLRETFKRDHRVLEVYTHTSRVTPKDIFRVADYEPPLSQFVDVDTTVSSVADEVQRVMAALLEVNKFRVTERDPVTISPIA